MKRIKNFEEFLNENFIERPADVEILNHDEKKMKKNGYIEVTVIEPIDGVEKDEVVLTSATEFSQLDKDAMITCYKGENEIIIPKKNLIIKM